MPFIKTIKNREGRVHVYLVEGYRKDGKVKQRTLKKFGLLDELEAEESGILERLRREAKAGVYTEEKTIQVSYDLLSPMNEPDKSYGWKIFDVLFEELRLEQFFKEHNDKLSSELSQILKLLVFQRILNPDSKL